MFFTRLGSACGVLLLLGAGCVTEKTVMPDAPPPKERTLLSSAGEAGRFEEHSPYAGQSNEREACLAAFNTDPATETAVFSDDRAGFSMEIPYNPSWGNDQYRIAPYELALADERFYYGPLRVFSGDRTCSWQRQTLYLFQPRTAEAQIKDQRLEAGNTGWNVKALELRVIGNVRVVDTTHAEIAGVSCHTLTVLGKKYNYRLTSCGDLPSVERMLGTMKLLD